MILRLPRAFDVASLREISWLCSAARSDGSRRCRAHLLFQESLEFAGALGGLGQQLLDINLRQHVGDVCCGVRVVPTDQDLEDVGALDRLDGDRFLKRQDRVFIVVDWDVFPGIQLVVGDAQRRA